ncbi:MAG: hypothetical protein ACR2JK_00045 [Geodermatophilaceae bacterium]
MIVALPDARQHGRRLVINPDPGGYLPVLEVLALFLGGVTDVRLVTDYVCGTGECDGRVALQGFSLGVGAGSRRRLARGETGANRCLAAADQHASPVGASVA